MAIGSEVKLDTDQVRQLAEKLVAAYKQLEAARPMKPEGGPRSKETGEFHRTLVSAIDIYNANRDALITKLSDQSKSLRRMAADFDALDEDIRLGMFNLENAAASIAPGETTDVATGVATGASTGTTVTAKGADASTGATAGTTTSTQASGGTASPSAGGGASGSSGKAW